MKKFNFYFDRDPWQVTLDPYRDWGRLLAFGLLGIVVVISLALYGLVLLEKTDPRVEETTVSSAVMLLDAKILEAVDARIRREEEGFNRQLEAQRLR